MDDASRWDCLIEHMTDNPEQLELFREMLMKTQIVSDNDYMFKG